MVSTTYGKSENLIKLKELSDKLCNVNSEDDVQYKDAVNEIANIVEVSEDVIVDEDNANDKLKCYEIMCSKLKIILNKFKIP
jgi:alpha-N-acetylglucosamine transferase